MYAIFIYLLQIIYSADFQAEERKRAMVNLTKHPGFRAAHPREEHFVPVYVAAGAGEAGDVRVITSLYGAQTFAFGC